MPDDFKPVDLLEHALHSWYLIAIAMIVGGVIALGISLLMPPLYQSKAYFSFDFDLAQMGLVSQLEEDYAVNSAALILYANPVQDKILQEIQSLNMNVTQQNLFGTIFVERQANTIQLRVLYDDPQKAALLLNQWMDEAAIALEDAAGHAAQYDLIRRHLDGLASCYEEMVSSLPVTAQCWSGSLTSLQNELSQTSSLLQTEKLGARGLIPGLRFSVPDHVLPATDRVRFGRNSIVLVGASLGFIMGLFLLILRWPKNLFRKAGNETVH